MLEKLFSRIFNFYDGINISYMQLILCLFGHFRSSEVLDRQRQSIQPWWGIEVRGIIRIGSFPRGRDRGFRYQTEEALPTKSRRSRREHSPSYYWSGRVGVRPYQEVAMQVDQRAWTSHWLCKGLPCPAAVTGSGTGQAITTGCFWTTPHLWADPISPPQPKGQGLASSCLHGYPEPKNPNQHQLLRPYQLDFDTIDSVWKRTSHTWCLWPPRLTHLFICILGVLSLFNAIKLVFCSSIKTVGMSWLILSCIHCFSVLEIGHK